MPAAGVVCDGTNQLCYDRNGLSLALTRTYFGQYAERIACKTSDHGYPCSALS